MHPSDAAYSPGDHPPWLSLLYAFARLRRADWHPAMKMLSDDAMSGNDEAFLKDWLGNDVGAPHALNLARRLLPDFFGNTPAHADPTAGARDCAIEDLELGLIRQWMGLEEGLRMQARQTLLVLLVGYEGVICTLDLQAVELPESLAAAHGALVCAPEAALLQLDASFEAGLDQVSGILQRVLAAERPCAVAWSLRAVHRKDGSGIPNAPYLQHVEGPSLTAACAVASLHLLRDQLAEPWKTNWHAVLRALEISRFCATAALSGYQLPAPHGLETVQTDPLKWMLVPVGGVPLKFDALGRYLPGWGGSDAGSKNGSGLKPIRYAFVAEHQELGSKGNLVKAEKCRTLADLIHAAYQASEPLQLPAVFRALEAALVGGGGAPTMEQVEAVHREPLPRWLAADQWPTEEVAEKVLRVWWLKRYAHWASGRFDAFGPQRGGPTDEPVSLPDHFQPIDIDPDPLNDGAQFSRREDALRTAERLRANSLPELFQKCPRDRAFRLHAAPAGGKTTLLAHHELHNAKEALRRFHGSGQWGELALWLPMRDYPARVATDPPAALEALWGRVQALYPDLARVLLAVREGRLHLPGLQLRWLCDAVNEMPAEGEDRRRRAQGHLFRGLTEEGAAQGWLSPVFTVRTHSQNQAMAGARGCTLLTWDAPSRNLYMEKRLGAGSEAYHILSDAIAVDRRDDRDKFFATPGHLAAQCTLMRGGIVSEPARNRAQLFCTLLWLRLAQEQQRGLLPDGLLSDAERDRLDRLHDTLAMPGGWRWPRRMGTLIHALSAMAVYQQHLDPESRARQQQGAAGEPQWSMSAPRGWLLQPPHSSPARPGSDVSESALIEAAQHLNLLHKDADGERLTWTHQLWLELFAALGLDTNDGGSAWIDAPVPRLPDMETLWQEHQAAGKPRDEFRLPAVPPVAEEETLRYLMQLRGDVVRVVKRVLEQGNAPLAARLVLENGAAFGEPLYPQDDALGPWRPERKAGEIGGTDPVLNALRLALHKRMYDPEVHISQRIEAGDLLGQLGGSPLYRISGQALVLRDEHWAQIGKPGGTIDFEMGDLQGDDHEQTAQGKLLPIKGLRAFRMACYLVSNAQYRCFVQSEDHGDPAWWPSEAGAWWKKASEERRQPWSLRQGGADGYGLAPVSGNFWQAQAYARWEAAQRREAGETAGQVQLQLASEAQWEAGARWAAYSQDRAGQGGESRWRFAHTPGSATRGGDKGNLSDSSGQDGQGTRFADVQPWDFNHDGITGWRRTPVGVFLEGRVLAEAPTLAGLPQDLAGNVWEWTRSARTKKLDQQVLETAKGTELRALRGGSYSITTARCRVGSRFGFAPVLGNLNDGFRLVWAFAW